MVPVVGGVVVLASWIVMLVCIASWLACIACATLVMANVVVNRLAVRLASKANRLGMLAC